MKQNKIIKLILLLVLYSVFSNAKSINWVPIVMGDITTFVPDTGGEIQNTNILHGAKLDKSGEGSYYQWDDADAIRGLVFDAHQDFTLKSVKVYNQQGQAATRVFTLYDASGDVVASESVDVKEGEQRITLNMRVPKGKDYKLMADIHKGLYKNDNVTGYPYKIGNAVTITGSDIDTSHYYFFYDWEVEIEKGEAGTQPSVSGQKRAVKYGEIIHKDWGFHDFPTNTTIRVSSLTSSVIQSAIDKASDSGGGTVVLPAGTGVLDEPVYLKDNVRVIGAVGSDGKAVTKLTPSDSIHMMFRGAGVRNVVVENIIFDAQGKDTTPLEFWGGGHHNVLINNNVILNVGLPKLEAQEVDVSIRNQHRKARNGINFYTDSQRSDHITVQNNYIDGTAVHAIDFKRVDKSIVNNNVGKTGGSGVDVSSDNHGVEVLNNDFSDYMEAIKVVGNGGKDLYIHNNYLHDNPKTNYWEPVTKTLQDGGGVAIFIQGNPQNLQIFDNYLDGNNNMPNRFVEIKLNEAGDDYYLRNNMSSDGKMAEKDPEHITHSQGAQIFTDVYENHASSETSSVHDSENMILHGGKPNKDGEGSYYQWDDADAIRGLVFDAHQDFTLKSVKVYNQQGQAATRVFTLFDASGNVVASESVDVKEGEQKITLNMHVPKGKDYKLMADIHKGLYKNDNVTGYPYKIGNAVTITGSDIDTSHYYFFYDWEVEFNNPTLPPVVKTKAYIPSLDFAKNDVYGNGRMVTVHTTNELDNALVHAEAYTTIILANGDYKNVHIYVSAGKHDITLKAQHPHKATIFPRGFDDASAIIFGRANTKNEEIHHINFIDIDVDGRGNNGQFIKSEGGATYSVHHIYFENMEFRNLKMGLYSGLHSHDWTVNRCNMHDSEVSHMWYMMGWHQAVINSAFYNGSHDILAIRGYYPDGETHTYIYDGDNSCHGNIYVENRYGRKGFLRKDVWTHLISGNKFLAWKRADNQRWRSNNHIGIGYGLYGDPVCGAERTYLPPQNIFIVNNTFSNEGEHNSLITDGITVDAWGGIESGKLSSINNIVVKNNTFIKDKDSESFIKSGDNSGDVTPDISKIHMQNNK